MEKQVIQSVGFRNISEGGKVTGFQLKIRLPYYRGVFLSQVKVGSIVVDGEEITITYSANVDFDADTDKNGKITADQTKNTVTVEPDAGTGYTDC